MEYSSILKKKAKDYGVPIQYLVMADLMVVGYGAADAHFIAYSADLVTWSTLKTKTERDRILGLPIFNNLLETRKAELTSGGIETKETDIELIGAEDTAKEILMVAMNMPENSKERGEMFMKYADLLRKNDSVAVDEDPVRIWLPLQCSKCPLLAAYNEAQKRNSGKILTSTEMEQIVSGVKLDKRLKK